MTDQEIQSLIEQKISEHSHDGLGSKSVDGKNLFKAPQSALTTKDSTALTTGGVNNLTTADATIIDNMRTRINELETKLRALGLIN